MINTQYQIESKCAGNVSSSNGLKGLTPQLRFQGFSNEWRQDLLCNVFSKINQRNTNGEIKNVICNSAQRGLIPQREYFDKDIANSDNANGYYIIKQDDFVYNPRKSVSAPYGPISVYKYSKDGIVSPLYLCFRSNEAINVTFYEWYFKAPVWHRYIYLYGDSGVRHDRVSIKDAVFFEMPLHIPNKAEQQKIADFLSLFEKKIQKQRQLIELLKSYKRGYFNRLIASFSTVEYYIKDIVEEYTQKTLTNGEYPILSSTMNGIKMQSAYFNKQAASENTIGYKIVPYGYFTYRSMSDTGEFHFNYQDIIEKGIVSPAYPVFMVKATNNSRYVEYILNELPIIKTQLMVVKEGGTRYALSFSKLQALHIPLPAKELQDKVENQILLFEKQEKAQELILEKMIALKTALLQQLFI